MRLPLVFHRAGPALLLLAAGCGSSSSDDDAFDVRTTDYAVNGATEIIVGGRWMVFFASEALTGPGGTDLNGDGDVTDDVAVAAKLTNRAENLLGVAGRTAGVVEGEVYVVVVESEDGVDWNGANGLADIVLLHWSESSGVVTFIDTLAPNIANLAIVSARDRVYYAADAVPVGDETTLRFIDADQPMMPVAVENVVGGGTLRPILHGEDDDMIVLHLDETVEGGDLNGDADATDGFVLALLDGTAQSSRIQNIGLAMADADAPVDVFDETENDDDIEDYLVGFLVNEAAQGNTNLNDPALFVNPLVPVSCAGTPDVDLADDVLHFVRFDDFESGMAGPENTGLAGRDRVVVIKDYVATLSSEAEATCDLNEDGDTLDTVARWVEAVTPVAPPVDPAEFYAVETTIPGGSMGLSGLEERYVIVVSEAQDSQDLDGKPQDHCLAAWLRPKDGNNARWKFRHQASASQTGTGIFEDTDGDGVGDPDDGRSEPYAGVSWMAAEKKDRRLPMTFLEEVPGTNPRVSSINNNLRCRIVNKDNDLIDALPVWADFENETLDLDGTGYAVDPMNAGIVIAQNWVFFRVVEADDARDYNQDGDMGDVCLFRNPLGNCNPRFMRVASNVQGPVLVVDEDRSRGGAFMTSEMLDSQDLNGDGDMLDLVIQYFQLN